MTKSTCEHVSKIITSAPEISLSGSPAPAKNRDYLILRLFENKWDSSNSNTDLPTRNENFNSSFVAGNIQV